MKIDCIATCPDEVKGLLAKELKEQGCGNVRERYRSVYFDCDERTFYRIHLQLRTSSKIFKVIRDFPARDWQMLFDQARRIKWNELFDVKHSFLVDGVQTSRGEGHMSSNIISKRVREALQGSFLNACGTAPKVDLEDPKIKINAYLERGRCILSFDTSGKAMHKRGYRLEGHPAPLKETLAAAVLKFLGYDGNQVLYDPMCGSGTFAIEAAYIALGKAPLIHRGKNEFGFEWLKSFNRELWREVQAEARASKRDQVQSKIIASDLLEEYVDLAKKNALRARVEKHITFFNADFFQFAHHESSGLLVANLPYGGRIEKGDRDSDFIDFYRRIGDQLKNNYKGWTAGLLVAKDTPHKFIGLKPNRKIDLKNGNIPVKLLVFKIY